MRAPDGRAGAGILGAWRFIFRGARRIRWWCRGFTIGAWRRWTAPTLVARAQYKWEDNRIGGSTAPIRTEAGWLVLYHGVETVNAAMRRVIYRLGAMMLDLKDPTKVIARCPHFVMAPEEYYERFGLHIPNVIFPTGAVVREGMLYLYYGCCDTSISLATVGLADLVRHVTG